MDNNELLDESQVLQASFRVAAESVTQLYKTAFQQRNIGYEQCLKDLLEYIEAHPNVQERRHLGANGLDAFIPVDYLLEFCHLKKEQISSLSRRSRDESITTRQQQQQQQQQQFIDQNQQQHQEQQRQQQQSSSQPLPTSQQNNQSTESQFQQHSPLNNIFENVQDNFNFSIPSSNITNSNNQNIQHEIDRLVSSQDIGVGTLSNNDSLKRRFNYNNGEINFLGRQITLDSSLYEPSHKKGRFRKDEL